MENSTRTCTLLTRPGTSCNEGFPLESQAKGSQNDPHKHCTFRNLSLGQSITQMNTTASSRGIPRGTERGIRIETDVQKHPCHIIGAGQPGEGSVFFPDWREQGTIPAMVGWNLGENCSFRGNGRSTRVITTFFLAIQPSSKDPGVTLRVLYGTGSVAVRISEIGRRAVMIVLG